MSSEAYEGSATRATNTSRGSFVACPARTEPASGAHGPALREASLRAEPTGAPAVRRNAPAPAGSADASRLHRPRDSGGGRLSTRCATATPAVPSAGRVDLDFGVPVHVDVPAG